MKRIASILLIACLLLTLAACSGKKANSDGICGTYKGSWVYNGKQINATLTLREDGTYTRISYINGELSDTISGEYEYKNDAVYCYDPNVPDHGGYVKYDVVNGELQNGGHSMKK